MQPAWWRSDIICGIDKFVFSRLLRIAQEVSVRHYYAKYLFGSCAIYICLSFLLLVPTVVYAIDISDMPLETAIVAAPPIVMIVYDNSGSMDMEFMTDEFQGLFKGAYYLFPDSAYKPRPDHEYGFGHALSALDRRRWRSQWAGYNHIYYSPNGHYHPWPATKRHVFHDADLNHPLSDPGQDSGPGPSVQMAANFFSIRSGAEDINVLNAHYFTHHDTDGNGVWNAGETVYLVTWTDNNRDGYLDLSEAIGGDRRRYFRLADDGDGVVEDYELIRVLDEAEKKLIRPVIQDDAGRFQRYLTDKEELQNFVNWFSYYRRREFAAKSAAAFALSNSGRMNAGLYAINAGPRIAARPINESPSENSDGAVEGHAGELLDALYAIESHGSTPLRSALDRVGRYLHQDYPSELGPSPFYSAESGGSCQRACAIVITDGFWNGSFSGAGNADGDSGKPYADAWGDTLSDVAMTYYESDLAPNLPDAVPPTRCDPAAYQHMNTYIVTFGYAGHPDNSDGITGGQYSAGCMPDDASVGADWPHPVGGPGVEGAGSNQESLPPQHGIRAPGVLEDLRHAALNGRGRYFDANSSKELTQALPEILTEMREPACAADVVVNGTGLTTDSRVYQVSYRTTDWSGEVSAYPLDSQTGQSSPSLGPQLWSASKMLSGASREIWDQRRIVTYGGKWMQSRGIPFRYNQMSAGQLLALGSDLTPKSSADDNAKDLIDFIRGKSFSKFRARESLLGDVVHSPPVLFGRTLFVGANDGMLHAFNVDSGAERFAYVPNLVCDHLKALSDLFYADHHRCYVDGPLYSGEVIMGEYQRNAYVVGGLGKGGKGYFCLLVGQRERSRVNDSFGDYQWKFHVDDLDSDSSEEQVGDLIRWEYPRPNSSNDSMDNDGDGFLDEAGEVDPHMGYSFSQAYAVNANCAEGSYRPVVIFGNGYGSDSQKALLYVLAVDSGEIVRVIDTGAAGDNGLSTPALIDVNLDRRVDYAYAGDLNGNLWKFDLTSDNPSKWGVAYGVDMDGDGVIDAAGGDLPAPLFQAQGQPITGRPDVMVMHGSCTAQAPGYMVFFGTGRYLGITDRSDASQQSLYAIWDYGDDSDDSEYLGRLTSRDGGNLSSGLALVRKQIVSEATLNGAAFRKLSADDIAYTMVADQLDNDGYAVNNTTKVQKNNPEYYAGWFFDFPMPADISISAGERVIGNAVVRGGKVIVPSYIPDSRPCSGGGRSWLYLLAACTGNAPLDLDGEPLSSSSYQGKISDRPVIIKDLSQPWQDLILFSDHTGRMWTLVMVGEKWGKVYWRQN